MPREGVGYAERSPEYDTTWSSWTRKGNAFEGKPHLVDERT